MKALQNLGHHERIIRVGIGIGLLALSGFSLLPEWGDLLLMAVGLIALLTGIVGYCPAWKIMGISTCNIAQNHSHSDTRSKIHNPNTR